MYSQLFSLWLPPRQTNTVVVSVTVPWGTQQGTRDKITFNCEGYEKTSQFLELKIISPMETQDTAPPSIVWFFGTRCDDHYGSAICSQHFWSLEITAQDLETGILRIDSTPPNDIIKRIPITAGTTKPVRVTYLTTCCQPRVTINVFDLAGNQRAATIDVRDIILTEATIVTITLGVLLLIMMTVLLIISIVWCCRKRRGSQNLSSYRSHPERTQ